MDNNCKHLDDERVTQPYVTHSKDDSWAIKGCCGGGCYIIYDFTFCPFCGIKLDRTTMPNYAYNCEWGSHDKDIKKKGKCEFCNGMELNK